jgi:hypothetical protein
VCVGFDEAREKKKRKKKVGFVEDDGFFFGKQRSQQERGTAFSCVYVDWHKDIKFSNCGVTAERQIKVPQQKFCCKCF